MKTKCIVPFLFLIFFAAGCRQTKDLNLDFEVIENGLPRDWSYDLRQPGFSVSLDSVDVVSGKYAIAMEFTGNIVDYHAFTYRLPDTYAGDTITLSAFMKTENVTDGFAGLWLMVDPDPAWRPYVLSFMEQKGVTGTNDWRKYEITLDLGSMQGHEVEIGGLLSGRGKMWLDDLSISIDGKDIEKAKLHRIKTFPAKEDKEFDRGSGVVFPELSQEKEDDLELLGRIWGFLKYHHPEIAKGNYNWDYELFRILPAYLAATDRRQRDDILVKWINRYGRIPGRTTCRSVSGSAFIKPDLSWITNGDMSSEVKELLHAIYANRNQGSHYYIGMRPYIGNPVFLNEEAYMGKDHYPDAGFRLLSLFRYWNMIHYFFPYKPLTDKDWNTVLNAYIPSFIEAGSRLEYELTCARLLGEICDSHAFLQQGWNNMESLKGSRWVPAVVKFIENQFVVAEPLQTGLKKGDIITHIDGKAVEIIADSIKPYYPASNPTSRMRAIASDIFRSDKDAVRITYTSSGGKTEHKNITTQNGKKWLYDFETNKETHPCFKFIGKDIGYINLGSISKEDIPGIKQAFADTKGIIIDIRNMPPDLFHMLAPCFVSETTSFSKFTQGNPDNPGEFMFSQVYRIPCSETFYKGKLAVIVGEGTVSNGEYSAMAFRAGKHTVIVGSQTGGYDGNISEIVLPGGLITYISGNGVYYPDGTQTQRVGIVPDVEVKPTVQAIREGRDEYLEKAVEIIRRE